MGPYSRRFRMLAAAGAAIAAVTMTSAVTAVAVAPAASARPVAAAASTGAGTGGTVRVSGQAESTRPFGITKNDSKTELLINGDRLTVSGKQALIAMAGTGFAAAVTEVRLGGQAYAIPDAAVPFLGRGLDPSLFDVAALPGGATLPVQITYSGRTPRLPGVTITHAAAGVATGYLTAASAPAFGAALTRQLAADYSKGSYGTDGIFAGGVTISLAGAVLPSTPRPKPTPQFKMHVLTVHGVDAAGKTDTGDIVYVFDSNDNAVFGDPVEAGNPFYHGIAKYSVPAGHYWALGDFIAFDKQLNPVSEHVVIDPRFNVSGNTSVTISGRSATDEVTFAAPQPASVNSLIVTLANTDGTGHSTNLWLFAEPSGVPLFISPTKQTLEAGTLREFVSAQLIAESQGAQPDTLPATYYLTLQGSTGVIGSQHYTIAANSLATVQASYSSDVATTGGLSLLGVSPAYLQYGLIFGLIDPISVPSQVTEYLTAGSDVYWLGQYFQSYNLLGGGQNDVTRTFAPGSVTRLGWNTYPLHTVLNTTVLGGNDPFGASLSATRVKNELTLDVTPFSDSTIGHTGSGFLQGFFGSIGNISGSYQIDANGKKIASGNPVQGGSDFFDQVNLPANPSTVAFTLTAGRTGALFPLSTATTTTWTWQSANVAETKLPSGWSCADGSQTCSVEPLLTLDYDVAGLGVDGTAPGGAQVVGLTIGHQELAATPDITSVSAAVSFDDGHTWQPASVTGSGGTQSAAFDAPSDSYVSLKVTAQDALGGSITETILRAYATATLADAKGRGIRTDAVDAVSGYRPACPAVGVGEVRCFVLYKPGTAAGLAQARQTVPPGWGALDIERAYKLPVARNPHETVAVVEAYDTPHLESYLNTYRKEYGLPPCTTANGCFRKVNEAGKAGPLPANGTYSGWDLEATLDVDMVSATCPKCHILVVEANSEAYGDLAAAVDTAVRLGAAAVSNSYGARENGFALAYASAYDHPGHAIVASSGDYGYSAASFPADLATVTAVGGTELAKAKNHRGWSETVWNEFAGAGSSGCSAYVAKPRWQHDTHCPGRTVADVAALAWNIAIYNKDWGGWGEIGGTSASSPIIAGIYGLAGNAARIKPGYEYAHARSLFDVTSGNNDWFAATNGAACGNDYLCVAKKGYDAPTGLGTPDGIGAF